MKLRTAALLLGLGLAILPQTARAQAFFTETFTSAPVNSHLLDAAHAYTESGGRLSNTTGNRAYVRTNDSDYNQADFTARVDIDTTQAAGSPGDQTVFFGIGTGEATPGTDGTPAQAISIVFSLTPNGQQSVQTFNNGTGKTTVLGTITQPGVYTLQVRKVGDRLTFSILSGGKTLLQTDKSLSTNAPFLKAGLCHLFFGTGQNAVAFDNFRILRSGVLTFHNDNNRTGQYTTETLLTPANVAQSTFRKLFTDPVDGQVYAQPLYVSAVNVPGKGTHNAVFVATQHNSVYAFDADTVSNPLWQVNFGPSVPAGDTQSGDITVEVGITSTPVIDPATDTLYALAKTKENGQYFQRLHAIDIRTGKERSGSPITINFSVPGTGDGASGGRVPFNALRENQRGALLLSREQVYLEWASHGDTDPYHGWVASYDAATLKLSGLFNDTPNGGRGGLWQSGTGPSADSDGNVYTVAGNGTFDTASGNFGEGVLKLKPGKTLTVSDYFVPFNYQNLNDRDADLGSGGALLLPDQSGPHKHLLLTGGKAGILYLVDRDNLGKVQASTNADVQEVEQDDNNGLYSCPAYFNGRVYYARKNGALKARSLSGGVLSGVTSQSVATFAFSGATPSVSSSGNKNGVVWTIANNGTATLRAYDASNLSTELYDSDQADGGRDTLGAYVKFAVPTVAKGKVYVGTKNGVTAFGLF